MPAMDAKRVIDVNAAVRAADPKTAIERFIYLHAPVQEEEGVPECWKKCLEAALNEAWSEGRMSCGLR